MVDESVKPKQAEAPFSLERFLVECPPDSSRRIADKPGVLSGPGKRYFFELPEIRLHCDTCDNDKPLLHKPTDVTKLVLSLGESDSCFVTYRCKQCEKNAKVYSLYVRFAGTEQHHALTAYKFGEMPPFGPPIPKRFNSILGEDRDLFFKGRRCESQGLGVAAFTYYRRVVETHKDRLIDEIIKVSQKEGAPAGQVALLEAAKKETQFSTSINMLKEAGVIPEALKIKGHNPMTLLHGPLSGGVHDYDEERCLSLAGDIRAVLFELAERMDQLLKKNDALEKAVSSLHKDQFQKSK